MPPGKLKRIVVDAPASDASSIAQPASVRAIRSSRGVDTLIVGAVSLVAALALWKSAGFHRLPAWEAWRIFDAFSRGEHGWWLMPGAGGFAGGSLRPLEVLPHQIGYMLSSDSFVGFNIVAMLAFVARAVAAYVVTREVLPGSRPVAFGASLIFALSPVTDGSMLDRTIHVQWAGALAMASFGALLFSVRRRRVWLAIASATLIPASLLMYEAALPVAVLMPLFVLIWADNRWIAFRMGCVYAVGVVAALAYSLWTRANADASYQQGIATTRRPILDHEGITAVAEAFKWEFGGFLKHAFANDLPMRRPDLTFGSFLLVAALGMLALLVVLLLRRHDTPALSGRRNLLLVAGFGIVWMVLSLAIFLPFLPYRYETLRVHSVAQFGLVLLFAVVTKVLMDHGRVAGTVLVVAGVVAASFVAVQNAGMWRHWSDFQSQLISALAIQSQGAPENTIVVRDETERLSHIYELGPSGIYLGVAHNLVVGGRARKVIICNTAGISAIGYAQMGPCTWTQDEFVIKSLPNFPDDSYRVPRSGILDLTLYAGDQPQLRRTDGTPSDTASTLLPERAQKFLPCLVGQPCAVRAVAADLPRPPVHEGFDRPYSYEDVPIRGLPLEGFGPIQLNIDSWRWTTTSDSAVFARLERGHYQIRIHVLRSFVHGAADSATVSINGIGLPTRRELDGHGGATLIAMATVDERSPVADRIGVQSQVAAVPDDPDNQLGLAVDSVAIEPWGRG